MKSEIKFLVAQNILFKFNLYWFWALSEKTQAFETYAIGHIFLRHGGPIDWRPIVSETEFQKIYGEEA